MKLNVARNDQVDIRSKRLKSTADDNEVTANDLLKFAGTWVGDDFEERLVEVYKVRGETSF